MSNFRRQPEVEVQFKDLWVGMYGAETTA